MSGLGAGAATRAGEHIAVQAMTRRRLLGLGATAAAAATLPAAPAFAARAARPDWMRRRSYVGRVGETFQARLPGGRRVSLRLAAVGDLVGTSPSGSALRRSDASFALELQGPAEPRLEQGIHELQHRAFGRGRLFLVPERAAGGLSRYAVVVNRAR